MVLLAGINGQQEQQANGTLLQSSNQQQQQQQHPRTPPSARSGSRLGLPQDQQQQRQATPQQPPASSHMMLLDVEQHPGVKTLLSLVQADRFGSKEAAAVWSDGQTATTILEVSACVIWPFILC
jgi:hypothetical protein